MNRLLVITSNIAPYRLRWCEELSKHFDVTIVYTKDHDYERDDRWLQKKSDKCHIIKLRNDKDKYDAFCFDVIDVLKDNPDSLVIFDGYGPKTNIIGLVWCRLHHRKSFVNVDGYALGEKRSAIKEIVKRFIITKLCDSFFCSSESAKEHLVSFGAKRDRIYVHNFSSITEDRIAKKLPGKKEKMELRKKLGIKTSKPIVLSVGAFIPRKRYEDLIQAIIACQSDCDLYLLGGKPTEGYLELVGDHDNIHFIDFVLPNEVDSYYLASDLFVLPSQTDVWGLVVNEAMAQGLPVISSDNCIAKCMIEGNGVIYETGNIEKLTEAIDYCLDAKRNREMSLQSLKNIREYTIEGMVERQLPAIESYFEKKV